MGIIEDVFQVEGKECKDRERLKMRRKSMPEQERCFSKGETTSSGPVEVDKKKFVEAAKNSAGKGEAEKGIKLLRACGSAKPGQVASRSPTQGLRLADKKVGSQVVSQD